MSTRTEAAGRLPGLVSERDGAGGGTTGLYLTQPGAAAMTKHSYITVTDQFCGAVGTPADHTAAGDCRACLAVIRQMATAVGEG